RLIPKYPMPLATALVVDWTRIELATDVCLGGMPARTSDQPETNKAPSQKGGAFVFRWTHRVLRYGRPGIRQSRRSPRRLALCLCLTALQFWEMPDQISVGGRPRFYSRLEASGLH